MSEYPERILPREKWRKGITGGEIVALCGKAVIGRRIDGRPADCIDKSLGEDNMSLKIDALPLNRIPDLSTNLLGALFRLEDFVFIQKGEGKMPWNGRETVPASMLVGSNYERQTGDMFVAGWLVCEVDKLPVPYRKTLPKKSDYEAFRKRVEADRAARTDVRTVYLEEYEKLPLNENRQRYCDAEGEVRIVHDPTNLNYWHFLVSLYPMDDHKHPISAAKTSWCRMMADNVGDFLRRTFCQLPEQMQPAAIEGWEELVEDTAASGADKV